MKIIKQETYTNSVVRIGDSLGSSRSWLLTSKFEGWVDLIFDMSTYEIKDAKWGVHRAYDEERRGEGTAFLLIGESCQIGKPNSIRTMPDYTRTVDYNNPPGGWKGERICKSSIDDGVGEVSREWKHIRELFNESLRGVLQAEEFMVVERGYKDIIEYEKANWCTDERSGYCAGYNDFLPELDDWELYIGADKHYRRDNLYNKYISITMTGDETIETVATYHDSFHEISVELIFDRASGEIKGYDNQFIRVPHTGCMTWQGKGADFLLGKNIKALKKKEIAGDFGGPKGCFHLLDILADIAEMASDI